jgi:ABC-type transport system substrate-binding protein
MRRGKNHRQHIADWAQYVYFLFILPTRCLKIFRFLLQYLTGNEDFVMQMRNCLTVLFSIFCLLAVTMPLHPGSGDTGLRIGIPNFPASLNPFYAMDEVSQAFLNKVFDSLFYFDGAGELQNGLVEGYIKQNNGQKFVLSIKKNIFFSNGKELDAGDVAATIERIKDRRFHCPYLSKLKFINRIEIRDKYTLELMLNHPPATWKNHLIFKVLNAGEIAGIKPEDFRHTTLSGTGAYRLHGVKEPSEIILKKNNHAQNRDMYDTLEYVVTADPRMAPLELLGGELDICGLSPGSADAYTGLNKWREKITVLKYKKFGYTYMVFNLKNSRLTLNVRKILYNLLIHGDFLDRFLETKGERVLTPFLLLNENVKVQQLSVLPQAKPLHLRVLTNAESKIRKEFVLFLRNELKKWNIHIEPHFREYHTFLRCIKDSRFDVAVSGFLLDIDYDMKDIFYSDSYFNYAKFQHPEMDVLLDRGLREFDPVKRKAIYLKAHDLWLKELPLLPLFNLYYYVGISKRIKIPDTVSTLVSSESDFLFNIKEWKR